MTTFVLVHGSWCGGWAWSRVKSFLDNENLTVHTPTLTGLAERQHLLGPDIGLDTHIDDITAYLEWHDISDAVLVGHSYGGMVISGAARRVPERIQHLVYLDAFAPQAGQSCVDIVPGIKDFFAELAVSHDGRYMTAPDLTGFGVTDPADLQWMTQRLTLMPHKAVTDPLPEAPASPNQCAATIINCTASDLFSHTIDAARARGWSVVDLDAGHCALVTHACEVASIVLKEV